MTIPHATIYRIVGRTHVSSFPFRRSRNPGAAFCRVVFAFSRHSAPGTCIDPNNVCVAVVSLWLSGDIDGSAWLRRLRGNPRALGGPAGAEGSRPREGYPGDAEAKQSRRYHQKAKVIPQR